VTPFGSISVTRLEIVRMFYRLLLIRPYYFDEPDEVLRYFRTIPSNLVRTICSFLIRHIVCRFVFTMPLDSYRTIAAARNNNGLAINERNGKSKRNT